jgi:hypothetical protein
MTTLEVGTMHHGLPWAGTIFRSSLCAEHASELFIRQHTLWDRTTVHSVTGNLIVNPFTAQLSVNLIHLVLHGSRAEHQHVGPLTKGDLARQFCLFMFYHDGFFLLVQLSGRDLFRIFPNGPTLSGVNGLGKELLPLQFADFGAFLGPMRGIFLVSNS